MINYEMEAELLYFIYHVPCYDLLITHREVDHHD